MTTKKITNPKLRLLFTGFTMGVADLVPGVSGGTIALLMGIYDELIHSIKLITGKVPALILQGRFKKAWQTIPFGFLVPVFGGIVLAITLLVNLIGYLLDNQPVYVWSFFFGLIIGSAYIVAKRIDNWEWKHAALAFLGATATFLLVGLPALNSEPSPPIVFLTGVIAISAMVLPGISGSLILVLLGQYENIVNAVSELKINTLIVFAAGAGLGLALFSRILSWLLHKHHALTLAFLSGVMIGSLRKVWPWQIEASDKTFTNIFPEASLAVLASFTLALFGLFVVLQLEKTGVAKEHDDIN